MIIKSPLGPNKTTTKNLVVASSNTINDQLWKMPSRHRIGFLTVQIKSKPEQEFQFFKDHQTHNFRKIFATVGYPGYITSLIGFGLSKKNSKATTTVQKQQSEK